MNRLHPLSAVFLALNRGLVGFVLPFFIATAIVGSGQVPDVVPLVGVPVLVGSIGAAIGIAYGVAYYYRFGYELDDDTFDIASGVIARRSREIPYRRIQNVDIRQGVLFQILGLATVSIETAGGGGTEARLHFVDEREATRLQQTIRARTAAATEGHRGAKRARRDRRPDEEVDRDGAVLEGDRVGEDTAAIEDDRSAARPDSVSDRDVDRPASDAEGTPAEGRPTESIEQPLPDRGQHPAEGPIPADDERGYFPAEDTADDPFPDAGFGYRTRRLFSLDSRELLLYSFASFRPAAAAAVIFLLFLASDAVIEYLIAVANPAGGPDELGAGTTGGYIVLSLVSLVHAVVVTYTLSVLYTFVSYYGFRLGKAGDDLVYERGLLQKYSGSIPLEKVQSLTITDNPIQRAIGHAGLWVETAGYGPDSNGGSQSAVPLAKVPRVHDFTERLTEIEPPLFERPTTVARRRYLARYTILATVLLAIAYGITRITALESWYLAAIAYLFVPPAAHLKWKHLGYYVGEKHIVIREGFWTRHTTVIPYYRVQTVSTRRSIFQRRLGLGSLVVDTASSRTFFWSTPTIHDVDVAVSRDAQNTVRERLQTALAERAVEDRVLGEDL